MELYRLHTEPFFKKLAQTIVEITSSSNNVCQLLSLLYLILHTKLNMSYTRVGTLIVATIYLQLIQNRYMFRSFTVLQYSHQHCVQPAASDVEVVGYL